jgi:membrane peptidoglycan carboxypeptidase
VSSKADDFDVRHRAAGRGRREADGGLAGGNGANVDYDLGYDAAGWDTDGFRSPEADYLDSNSRGHGAGSIGTAVRTGYGRVRDGHRPGAHSRPAGGPDPRTGGGAQANGADTGRSGWESEATGALWAPQAPGRGGDPDGPTGPYRPDGPTGPYQPGGPRRPLPPGGPRGPRGPQRQPPRGRGRAKIKGSWWRHWTLRKALGLLLSIVGGFIVLAAITIAVAYEKTPVPTDAMATTSYSQSVVYSASGTLIGRFGTTNREMLTYQQLNQDPYLINAVLAAEDRNFFHEGGISPLGITRAAYEDVRGGDGSLQGGSTITQEFVRQYYSGIGTQQTFSRKIKEIFVSMKIAKDKSKQWILTNYLNTIYLGQGAYGVEAASQTYFGEPVAKLTVAQAAVIAAIIQQPSTYPLPQYQAQLENRWHYVLSGMVQMGTLSQQQAATMTFPKLGHNIPQSLGKDVWDPYVLNMVYNELVDTYGFSQSQIYNGGYTIRTSIDDSKVTALYQAVRDNEATIDESSEPFAPTYMHAGAVLEDPTSGAIQALYPGPGYPGYKYNGTGKVISKNYCAKISCEVNMAVYNREQVGSSFKPYILAAAIKQGMNVKTSTLDGFNNLYIPKDTEPKTYPATAVPAGAYGWYLVHNDDTGENGPYTPQIAMAVSINTAYADLWHVVAGTNGAHVVGMASLFGVNTSASGLVGMEDQAGTALGQASLTVAEQATMLATIDDGGVYHQAHVITKITRNSAPPTLIKVASYPVFDPDATINANEDSQLQYAMSEDDASFGTAPVAAMSNGQEIIAKTGTTNTAQSAFFIGAIPKQALAVAMFTNEQGKGKQTLNNLGGNSQGGMGGTWPATIWHTYAENEFVPMGVQTFSAPVFTGATWNLVPPGQRTVPKKAKKGGQGRHNGQPSGPANPYPYPTYSCNPSVVTCGQAGETQSVSATKAGAAVGGILAGVPATCLWARRRQRKRASRRG